MSGQVPVSTVIIAPIAALFLFASALLMNNAVLAEPMPAYAEPSIDNSIGPIKPPLDFSDEIAALDAVQIALTEAADGSTYIWQRHHGRLNGAIRMTGTFRGGDGRICRHLVMSLTAGRYTRKTEGIACRDKDRVWSLEG